MNTERTGRMKRSGIRWARVAGATLMITSAFTGIVIGRADPAGAVVDQVGFDNPSTSVDEEAGIITIDVSRSDSTEKASVDYTVSGTNGGDFTIAQGTAGGTLDFAVGQTTASLSVTIVDDTAGEPTEHFTITLSNPQNDASPGDLSIAAGRESHDLAISDEANGSKGQIEFTSSTENVNEADVDTTLDVELTRTGGSEGSVSATLLSADGSAVAGSDYGAVNTPVTFANGEDANVTVPVTIIGDNVVEGPESFGLALAGDVGALNSKVVNINDDDLAGSVRIASATYNVGEAGGSVTITLERIGGTDGAVVVNYATSDGSATAGSDYVAASGVKAFGSGQTSKTVNVTINDDFAAEGNEDFTFSLTSGPTSAPTSAVVTIIDNDQPLNANLDSYTTPEDTTLNSPFGVLANDTGPGAAVLSVDSIDTSILKGEITAFDNATGQFTYVPLENFNGDDFFFYDLIDGLGGHDTGTVRISVTDSNAAPQIVDDEFGDVLRSEPSSLDVLANDTDQDLDPLTITTGTLTTAAGNEVDCSSGTACEFTPVGGYVGQDSFTYSAEDPAGASGTATVTLFVGMPRACDLTGSNLVGTAADEVLCGTSGDDVISGGGGNDVILGFEGDDTLSGGDGKDLLVGGPGDDDLTPGPGEKDTSVGGDGIDTVHYVGTGAGTGSATGADTVVLTEDSVSIDTVNDGVTPAQGEDDSDLHESVENILLELGEGNDQVTVQPGITATMDLDGGPGFDRIQYDITGLSGVTDSGSVISATGRQPVTYQAFEVVKTESFFVIGTPGPDNRRFLSSAPEGLIVDLLDSGDVLQIDFGSLAGPVNVTDSGATGDDRLIAHGTSGADSFEIGATSVDRGTETMGYSGVEELEVQGAAGDDVFLIDVGVGFKPVSLSPDLLVDGGSGADTLELRAETACQVESGTVSVAGVGSFSISSVETVHAICGGVEHTYSFTSGYWVVSSAGVVTGFGGVGDHGDLEGTTVLSPVSGMAAPPDRQGYWLVQRDGSVTAFGSAPDAGDLPSIGVVPRSPIVGITPDATGRGYFLLGADGGVFAFGDAVFRGSTGDITLDQPVVAMASNPLGGGYWFVAADGGIFTYGPGTGFHGSIPQVVPFEDLAAPIVGMAPTATGRGYWLVAADGGVFAFGDAPFLGSVPGVLAPGQTLQAPIVGMTATSSGRGYWIVAADGGVFTFGDAEFFGAFGVPGVTSIVGLFG